MVRKPALDGVYLGFARGQVIVPGSLGATQTPAPPAENVGPPRTGDGGLADSDAGAGWTAALLVASLVIVPGLLLLARKREINVRYSRGPRGRRSWSSASC